ncbi:MAG: hypothetical protein HY098_02565 [Nitrospinae bacterium]|nr:hypothetical protein [Nitrospinota bacterium]
MAYWVDLFTGTTWNEFIVAGKSVTGFTQRRRNIVSQIKPGDILLCYLTGVQRWVGALEVQGPSQDKSDIWQVAEFPVRLAVKPIILLQPEYGIPMEELLGKGRFFSRCITPWKV